MVHRFEGGGSVGARWLSGEEVEVRVGGGARGGWGRGRESVGGEGCFAGKEAAQIEGAGWRGGGMARFAAAVSPRASSPQLTSSREGWFAVRDSSPRRIVRRERW